MPTVAGSTIIGSIPPILFIVFNRPENTKQVFEVIKKVRPQRLFIAADGPRFPLKEEFTLCEQTRAIVDEIDWECEVQTLFQDTNLGCGQGVSSAIDWFFSHVEEGIILEDDCVPSLQFFDFCTLMLATYRNDKSAMMIAGTSNLFGKYDYTGHYFSKYYSIWGWATWRRAWQLYDFSMQDWRSRVSEKELAHFFNNKKIVQKWAHVFDSVKQKKIDTWDAQWTFTCIKNKGFSVCSPYNMISNIGLYGVHANGKKSIFHEMLMQQFDIKKAVGNKLSQQLAAGLDIETYRVNNFFYHDPLWRQACRRIKKGVKQILEYFI